jgi:hypothetical protein
VTSILDSTEVTVRRRGGTVYVWSAAHGLHARGASLEEAMAVLEAAYAEAAAFSRDTGLGPLAAAPRRLRWPPGLTRALAILVISGLIAMQFGYAISIGVARGVSNLNIPTSREIKQDLTQWLLKQGEAGAQPDPQDEAIIRALRVLHDRYRPYWDAVSGSDTKTPAN